MSDQIMAAEQAFIDSLPAGDITAEAGVSPPDGNPSDAHSGSPAQPETAAPDQHQPDDGATAGTDSEAFMARADLDALLADIQDPAARDAVERAYKSFQGGYTRKTQELAEKSKALGDLDPELAQEAVEFYTRLQSDPAFALEVHEYLSKSFQELGLTPAQADQAARDEVARQTEGAQPDFPNADEDPDAAETARIEALEHKIQEFEAREQERLARQQEDELAAGLMQQEMALRQSNPQLKEQEVDRIYDIALAKGTNLFEAASEYEAWKQEILTDYAEQKATVTDRVDSPPAAPAQQAPEVPRDERGNVDLEQVHRIAMQRLANSLGGAE